MRKVKAAGAAAAAAAAEAKADRQSVAHSVVTCFVADMGGAHCRPDHIVADAPPAIKAARRSSLRAALFDL
eukprot:CAMPEP_0172936076 /NCGR_PEP_ID=MMETSP1075-20121228/221831_1 /TAXON_ID=2916 /ORGANISM="Ceratium fusus, Strain PA161109" /LENGTH=70 /DNA_ID=CAMNT_0013797443 /DNA_START=78 /DNA_END=291 /DNA_ORIENTATION=+